MFSYSFNNVKKKLFSEILPIIAVAADLIAPRGERGTDKNVFAELSVSVYGQGVSVVCA
jgi:hypothetical protein